MSKFMNAAEKRRLLENIGLLVKTPARADEGTVQDLFNDLGKLFSEILSKDVQVVLVDTREMKR